MPLAHGVDPILQPSSYSAEKNPDPSPPVPPSPRYITSLSTIPYSNVFFSGSWDGVIKAWQISADRKRFDWIANTGLLTTNDTTEDGESKTPFRGVVNDICVFEKGKRGEHGFGVVAAIGQESRLGRFMKVKGRNAGVLFDVDRIPKLTNGHLSAPDAI